MLTLGNPLSAIPKIIINNNNINDKIFDYEKKVYASSLELIDGVIRNDGTKCDDQWRQR